MDGRELTTLFDLSSNESSSSAAETKSCSEWEAQAACRESSYNCQIHCGWSPLFSRDSGTKKGGSSGCISHVSLHVFERYTNTEAHTQTLLPPNQAQAALALPPHIPNLAPPASPAADLLDGALLPLPRGRLPRRWRLR